MRAAELGRHGEIYNVGGGESRSTNWVVAAIQRLVGREVAISHAEARPGEQREALADTTKARRELDWSPKTSLEEGLAAQIAWQREASAVRA